MGSPVVTTEILAQLYGTDTHNITKNHRENTGRFIEGKHYFKLQGEELREFKHRVTMGDSVKIAKNVNALLLWIERGAARHAKMLDTEKAWEVFEQLEDCYFGGRGREAPHGPEALPAPAIGPAQQDALQQLVARRAEGDPKRIKYLWSRFNHHFKLGSYQQLPASEFGAAADYLESLPLPGGRQLALPLDPLTPDLLNAIVRKAHALALDGMATLSAGLERELRARAAHSTPQQLAEWLARVDGRGAGLVLVTADELATLCAQVRTAEIGVAAAMGAIHALEARTGRAWYGRPADR
ncbi:hypothetical protein MishRS11D_13030 [Methylomagnum ishizawai]|nr:hypothetical protein MishRS11D_13030 [Methylomagnum ishizawai]